MYAAVFICSILIGTCFATIDPEVYGTLSECEAALPVATQVASKALTEGVIPPAADHYVWECCSPEPFDPMNKPRCMNDEDGI